MSNWTPTEIHRGHPAQVVSRPTKFFVVYIDQHLSWKEHIKDIYTEIAETIISYHFTRAMHPKFETFFIIP